MANKASRIKWTKKLKATVTSVSLAFAVALGGGVAAICLTNGGSNSPVVETTAAEKTITFGETINIYSADDWSTVINTAGDGETDTTVTYIHAKLCANVTAPSSGDFGTEEAAFQGGAFYVPAGRHIYLDLQNYTINRNLSTARTDGSVFINAGDLYITSTADGGKGTITGGFTSGAGGGVLSQANSKLTLDGANIKGNTASSFGAGVETEGELYIKGKTLITENHAGSEGGGVLMAAGSSLKMTGGTISKNRAQKAGGIRTQGSAEISNAVITENISEAGTGGGIQVHSGSLTLTDTEVTKNTATNTGGGVYVGAASLNITGGTFSNNTSNSEGGAIFYATSSILNTDASGKSIPLTMSGVTMSNNTSASAGGAVRSNVALNISNSTFDGNWSKSNGGGALDLRSSVSTTLNNITVTNNKIGFIDDNTSLKNGGGLILYAPTAEGEALTINGNSLIEGNQAQFGGGGILVAGGNVVLGSDSTTEKLEIKNNSSLTGGGIHVCNSNTTLVINKSVEFDGNTASGSGGGVYVDGATTVTMNGGTISNNNANGTTDTTTGGGGIYVADNAEFAMHGGTISGNYSASRGGAMRLGTHKSGSKYVIDQTKGEVLIENNTADIHSGGISTMTTVTLEVTGATFRGNKSLKESGGAMYLATNNTVKLTNVLFEENTTATNGGAVASNGASLTMTGCTIRNNVSFQSGGALYTLNSSNGGATNPTTTTATLTNCTISNNTVGGTASGGAIFNNGNVALTIDGGTISNNVSGNLGGGIYTANGATIKGNAQILNNSARGNGGGIYSAAGTLSITGGNSTTPSATISGNEALNYGGGIYVQAGSLTANYTTISENTALSGGGVFTNATFSLNNSQINNNVASEDGGGIYARIFTEPAIISGSNIDSNTARYGGGASIGAPVSFNAVGQLIGNTATADGGGLYIWSASYSVNFMGTYEISEGTAVNGGGIYFSSNAVSSFNAGCIIVIGNNTATNGGGIYNASVKITFPNSSDVEITSNTALSDGGGIYNVGTITFGDANFLCYDNTSLNQTNNFYFADGGKIAGTVSSTVTLASPSRVGVSAAKFNTSLANTVVQNISGSSSPSGLSGGSGSQWAPDNPTLYTLASASGNLLYLTLRSGIATNASRWASAVSTSLSSGTVQTFTLTSDWNASGGDFGRGAPMDTSTGSGAITPYDDKGALRVPSGAKIVLDLNGYTLNRGATADYSTGGVVQRVIVIDTGAELTIKGNGDITGAFVNADDGSAIYNNGKLTINGGTIHGNECYGYNYAFDGGAVYNDGELIMNGGAIGKSGSANTNKSNSSSYTMNGGGVHNYGTFTMNGGTIAYNAATNGAGVYNVGTFTMNGGSISNNSYSNGNGGYGMGVYSRDTFTMNGGNINNNCGPSGGLYVVGGTFTMNGGNINNNTGTGSAGGVHISTGTVNLLGGTIYSNSAYVTGGVALGSGTLNIGAKNGSTLSGSVRIYGNSSTFATDGKGGGVCMGGGTCNFYSGSIYNNTSSGSGGGVQISGGTFNMEGGYIYSNRASTNGGGIFLAGSLANAVNISGGEIYNNYCATVTTTGSGSSAYTTTNYCGNGGGVYVSGGSTLNLKGKAKIWGNTAVNGGGIFGGYSNEKGASINVSENAEIYNNSSSPVAVTTGSARVSSSSTGSGGGICGTGYCNIQITGGKIYGNKVPTGSDTTGFGGGVYSGGTVSVKGNAEIYSNTAKTSGGGVYASAYWFDLDGTAKIYKNSAVNGGGIYLSNLSYDYIKGNVEIYQNSATNGGGIYCAGGTTEISGSAKIYKNTAGSGAGILSYATVNMTGGTIRGNIGSHGGGMYVFSTFTMNGGTISGNTADLGGGVLVGNGSETTLKNGTITGNSADQGGGVYVAEITTQFSMQGGTISGNKANNGAGVFVAISNDKTEQGSFELKAGTITGNTASENGGGVYNFGVMTMFGGTISANTAVNGGGGIALGENCTFEMINGTITGNSSSSTGADSKGGGIYAYTGSTVKISGGEISSNTAVRGGGLYLRECAVFTVSGTAEICNNNAVKGTDGGYGGGIYAYGTTTKGTISGGNIHHNTAVNGGAMLINGTYELTISGGTIANNTATDHGGAIYIDGTVILDGGTINQNTAKNNGGGVCVMGTLEFKKGTISNNTAGAYGGGIFVSGALTMSGGTISANTAGACGGGVYAGEGTAEIGGAKISANTAPYGGGIYAYSGTLELKAGTVIGGDTKEDGNSAPYMGRNSTDGGGLYILDATVTTSGNVQIKNNSAYSGGGVYMYSGGLKSDVNLKITDNTAVYGGGIYVLYLDDDNSAELNDVKGTISGNEAKHYGGGIYISSTGGATFYTKGGLTVTGNTAGAELAKLYGDDQYGAGVYLDDHARFNIAGLVNVTDNENACGTTDNVRIEMYNAKDVSGSEHYTAIDVSGKLDSASRIGLSIKLDDLTADNEGRQITASYGKNCGLATTADASGVAAAREIFIPDDDRFVVGISASGTSAEVIISEYRTVTIAIEDGEDETLFVVPGTNVSFSTAAGKIVFAYNDAGTNVTKQVATSEAAGYHSYLYYDDPATELKSNEGVLANITTDRTINLGYHADENTPYMLYYVLEKADGSYADYTNGVLNESYDYVAGAASSTSGVVAVSGLTGTTGTTATIRNAADNSWLGSFANKGGYALDTDATGEIAKIGGDGNTVVIVHLKRRTFKVTYASDGANVPSATSGFLGWERNLRFGETVVDPMKTDDGYVNMGTTAATLGLPTKAGHKFLGWYLESDFSGDAISDHELTDENGQAITTKTFAQANIQITDRDITLYAKWVQVDNIINFHYFDKNPYDIEQGIDNYNYGDEDNDGVDDHLVIVTEDGPYYYAVAKADQGGRGEDSFSYFRPSTAIQLRNPSAVGFKFLGWFDAEGNSVSRVPRYCMEDMDVYARWEPTTCDVTFELHGGSLTGTANSYMNGQPYGTLPTPTRNGYAFVGWYSDDVYQQLADASGNVNAADFNPQDQVTVTDIATLCGVVDDIDYNKLHAVWRAQSYTITYTEEGNASGTQLGNLMIKVGDGAEKAIGSYTTEERERLFVYGAQITYRVVALANNGYSVESVKLNGAGIINGAPKELRENVTISASFSQLTYTIRYTYNGGTAVNGEDGFVRTFTVTTNGNVALPAGTQVTRNGYTLSGWKLLNGSDTLNNIGDMRTELFDEEHGLRNVTLYAVWTPRTHYVFTHFRTNLEDATIMGHDHIVINRDQWSDTVTISISELENNEMTQNYTLIGWATKPNSRVIAVPVDTEKYLDDGVTPNPNYGKGTYRIKLEDYTADASMSGTGSLNNLYAIWQVTGEQTLLMSSSLPDGGTEVDYGTGFTISATPFKNSYNSSDPDLVLTFQWYKDGAECGEPIIRNAANRHEKDEHGEDIFASDKEWMTVSLPIKNVADSGTYTCELSVTGNASAAAGGSGEIEVTVNKAAFNGYRFLDGSSDYTASAKTWYVKYGTNFNQNANPNIAIDGGETIGVQYTTTLNGNVVTEMKDAGVYTITAHFVLDENTNYLDIADVVCLYTINPKKITSVTYTMTDADGKTYSGFKGAFNGKDYTITATSADIIAGDEVIIGISDGVNSAVDSYQATLSNVLTGAQAGNYDLQISQAANMTQSYEITKAVHSLTGLDFAADFEGATVKYDGNLHETYLVYTTGEGDEQTETRIYDGDTVEINGFNLTFGYTLNVQMNNVYTDGARTLYGGVAAGAYTVTVTLREDAANAGNFEAIEDMTATFTVSQADFFTDGGYDKATLLGGYVSSTHEFTTDPDGYGRPVIDGKIYAADGVTVLMDLNDAQLFSITYNFVKGTDEAATTVFTGSGAEVLNPDVFVGLNEAGYYVLTAEISFVDQTYLNNYADIDDVVITYTIGQGTVDSIEVELSSTVQWYGEEFDKNLITSIKVKYQNTGEITYSDERRLGCIVLDPATNEALGAFNHVGTYPIKITFIGGEETVNLTIKQRITEVSEWQYSADGGAHWKNIEEEEDGLQYSKDGYLFRAAFGASGVTANSSATGYAPATVKLNGTDVAMVGDKYVLDANKTYTLVATVSGDTDGVYVLGTMSGTPEVFTQGLNGEVEIIKNTQISVNWYYDGQPISGPVGIFDGSTDYFSGITATYDLGDGNGEQSLAVSFVETTVSDMVHAGTYKVKAAQLPDSGNYKLSGITADVTVAAQPLDSSVTYEWQYYDGSEWVKIPDNFALAYKGGVYELRIFIANGDGQADDIIIGVSGTGTNADNDTIRNVDTYTLECSSGDYCLPTGVTPPTFTISPVELQVSWSYDGDVEKYIYNGEEQTFRASVTGVGDDGNDLINVRDGVKIAANGYTAVATLKDEFASNYTLAGASHSWTIAQLAVTVTWNTDTFTYNGSVQVPEITATNIIPEDYLNFEPTTFAYALGSVNTSRENVKNANRGGETYRIIPTFHGPSSILGNYSFENVEKTFVIEKATPVFTVSYTEYANPNTTYNRNGGLREEKLARSNTDVAGTLEFLVDGVVKAGSEINLSTVGLLTNVKYRFTPDDALNYNVVDGTIGTNGITVSNDSRINSLYLTGGKTTYIVQQTVSLAGIQVYQMYASSYVEGEDRFGQFTTVDSGVSYTINGRSAINYRISAMPANGKLTLTATVENSTGTMELTVISSMPTSVTVPASAIKKDWYVGETFSWNDLDFTLTFADNSTTTVKGSEGITCNLSNAQFNANDVGEKNVVFTFSVEGSGSVSAAPVTINVKAKENLNININNGDQFKVEYRAGQSADWSKYRVTFTEDDNDHMTAAEIGATVEYTVKLGNDVVDSETGLTQMATYTVTARILHAGSTRYNNCDETITYSIVVTDKIYTPVFEKPATLTHTYTGSKLVIPEGEVTAVKDINGNDISSLDGVTVEYALKDATELRNVGDYVIVATIKLNGEVIATEEYEFKITKATLGVTVTVNNNIVVKTDGRVDVGARVNVTLGGNATTLGAGTEIIQYREVGTEVWSYDAPTTVGEYEVMAIIPVGDTHVRSQSPIVRFSVKRAGISSANTQQGGANVGITNPSGIENGVTIDFKEVENAASVLKVKSQTVLAGYEITLKKGDEVYTPTSEMTVSIELTEDLKAKEELSVYYIDEDGNAVDLDAERQTGDDGKEYLVFKTSEFATFAITEKSAGAPGGLVAAVVIGAVAAAGMAVACGVVFKKKRR